MTVLFSTELQKYSGELKTATARLVSFPFKRWHLESPLSLSLRYLETWMLDRDGTSCYTFSFFSVYFSLMINDVEYNFTCLLAITFHVFIGHHWSSFVFLIPYISTILWYMPLSVWLISLAWYTLGPSMMAQMLISFIFL